MSALGQDQPTIPDELDNIDFNFIMKEYYRRMDEYCPSGVEKCECLNAPGMSTLFKHLTFNTSKYTMLMGKEGK